MNDEQEASSIARQSQRPEFFGLYVIALLLLMGTGIGVNLLLLHQDVKKCERIASIVHRKIEGIPASSDPTVTLKLADDILKLMSQPGADCTDTASAFSAALDKATAIIFSLITGGALTASAMGINRRDP